MAATLADPGASYRGTPAGLLRRSPFARRSLHDLLFCLAGVVTWAGVVAALLALPMSLGILSRLAAGQAPFATGDWGDPAGHGVLAFFAGVLAGAALLATATPRVARVATRAHRSLAARLLGESIPDPAPIRRRGRGPLGYLAAGLRDRSGWRAVVYLLAKVPLGIFDGYAVFCWAAGLANLTYPFWWRLFRNHPPGVQLDPVPVLTPLGAFRVGTFAGTLLAFAAGLAMLLSAPWIAAGVNAVDRGLMRGLLGPGRLAQRVRDLEESRARAVDDAAEQLRRVERDLHDGAQMRLAALAMNLGRAKERLAADADPEDLVRARELVDAAHRSAKDALVELRNLARGIHPPVLDTGLADALATLAACSAVPVRLRTDIPVRPSPAIASIAYFCAAELLTNTAKHSHADQVSLSVTQQGEVLWLVVADNGVGGADPEQGSGLAGLVQRTRTVDGRLDIVSPPGGPTRVTVCLPLRA